MKSSNWSTWTTLGGVALIILGLVVATETLPLPLARPLSLGIMIGGIGLALAFVDALLTGRVSFRARSSGTSETFTGISGRLWGVNMCFAGALLFLGGAVEWLRPGTLWLFLSSSPGIGLVLVVFGLLVTTGSTIRLIGPQEDRVGALNRLFLNVQRPFFFIYLLVGLALVTAGAWQLLNPGAIEAVVRDLVPPLPTPLP